MARLYWLARYTLGQLPCRLLRHRWRIQERQTVTYEECRRCHTRRPAKMLRHEVRLRERHR